MAGCIDAWVNFVHPRKRVHHDHVLTHLAEVLGVELVRACDLDVLVFVGKAFLLDAGHVDHIRGVKRAVEVSGLGH